jgi:tRNA pseudouridine38-40 synthase
MVGALIYIGKGKYPAEHMHVLLEGRDRTQSPPTFSPDGLYLTGVYYHPKWALPETERSLVLL